jgi:hypothetical protein
MLLDNGKLNAQRLIGGHASGKKLYKIVVGDSGTAVTSADTAITNPVAKAITSVTYNADGTVVFEAGLLAGDPAMTIREMGLYNEDDVLCYRKVVADKAKVAGVSYALTYTIKVQ